MSLFPASSRFPFRYASFAALLALVLAPAAWPHPLGDFSINQYFIVDGNAGRPAFHFLLDVAEIPSFTELDLLDTDYDSEISQTEVETYLNQRIPELARFLHLRVNGEETPISVTRHKLVLLQGNGGMVVFNIVLSLEAAVAEWPDNQPVTIAVESENYPDEQGSRECLVLGGSRFTDTTRSLGNETAEGQEPVEQGAAAAHVYGNRKAAFTVQLTPGAAPTPEITLEEALQFAWTSTARLAIEAGEMNLGAGIASALIDSGFRAGAPGAATPLVNVGGDVAPETLSSGVRQTPDTFASRLMDQVSRIVRSEDTPPPLLAFGLVIAVLLGMGHALAPGHGKTVMAAYLIGEQGTTRHAAVLGVVVTLTHTWSVLLLGVVTLYFEGWLSEKQVNFWTGVISGTIIAVIGLTLFRQRYHRLLASQSAGAGSWHVDHGHDHAPEPGAPALEDTGKPPTYRNILWLGISGGVVPCPAALIVLLLALKFGRLTYGLALILAFSLGLAAVLVIIGILVVHASKVLQRQKLTNHPALQLMPLGSALLITLLGGWVIMWTLIQFDLLRFG